MSLAVEFDKLQAVVGFVINLKNIGELQYGKESALEVTHDGLVAAKLLLYFNRLEDIDDCDIFVITLPTTIDKTKRPDLTPLVKSNETIGKVMKAGA